MYFFKREILFFCSKKNFIIWCQSHGRLCVKFSFRFLSLFPDLTAWWKIFSKNKWEHFLHNYLRVLFCSVLYLGHNHFWRQNNIGLSLLTSLQFIIWYVAGFYKPTIPQSPSSYLQDYCTYTSFQRLKFSALLFQALKNFAWKIVSTIEVWPTTSRPKPQQLSQWWS